MAMRRDGTDGPDQINGTPDNDVINGLGGNDVIAGEGGADVLVGGAGRDRIGGGSGNDYILAGTDNDTIDGDSGQDTIRAGAGNDTARGGTGNDRIYGEAGIDTLQGGPGNDWLDGGDVTNTLYGGDGNDILIWQTGPIELRNQGVLSPTFDGGAGFDTLRIDNDVIYYLDDYEGGWIGPFAGEVGILAGDGALDLKIGRATPEDPPGIFAVIRNIERFEVSGLGPVYLETRSDVPIDYTIVASSHEDVLSAGAGNQVLYGEDGNDSLDGREGNDRLYGGSGNDRLSGGSNRDWLDGGPGEDTFYGYLPDMLGERIAVFEGAGRPGGDRLELLLSGPPNSLQVTEYAGFTTFDVLGDNSSVVLRVDATNMEPGVDYFYT
jgi:Ca2+-binding RTX toxin-like protein